MFGIVILDVFVSKMFGVLQKLRIIWGDMILKIDLSAYVCSWVLKHHKSETYQQPVSRVVFADGGAMGRWSERRRRLEANEEPEPLNIGD